jgi:DNA mismatch repair ATPase MutL
LKRRTKFDSYYSDSCNNNSNKVTLLHQQYDTKIDQQSATTIPQTLSKADLHNAKVLCQVDKKYILAKLLNNSLIMVDQHAADERVKLEEMLRSTFIKSNVLEPRICLELESELDYWTLMDDRTLKYLKIWGIHIMKVNSNNNVIGATSFTSPHNYNMAQPSSFNSESSHFIQCPSKEQQYISQQQMKEKSRQKIHINKVYVTQLPYTIIDRCTANHTLLKDLIKEYAYWLQKQTDEAIIKRTCPKGIMEMLKSKACRSNTKQYQYLLFKWYACIFY